MADITITIRTGSWVRQFIEQETMQLPLSQGMTVSDALSQLPIPPDEIGITALNGKAVPSSTTLSNGDTLEVLPLIIGG